MAKKPWNIKVNRNFLPKISIIVPTYNEEKIIRYKLKNLTKLKYPRSLMQVVFVDSNSSDSTVNRIKEFINNNRDVNVKLIIENQRRGKSAALNAALKECDGEVIIISDADCFWPSEILYKTLPYMADSQVGAISGPKKLLNIKESQVIKNVNKRRSVTGILNIK